MYLTTSAPGVEGMDLIQGHLIAAIAQSLQDNVDGWISPQISLSDDRRYLVLRFLDL